MGNIFLLIYPSNIILLELVCQFFFQLNSTLRAPDSRTDSLTPDPLTLVKGGTAAVLDLDKKLRASGTYSTQFIILLKFLVV